MCRWSASVLVVVVGLAKVALGAAAPCDSTDSCLRVIEVQQRQTQALVARFEQTKHLSLLAEPLITRGRFAFKQPDQVLWQIDEPALTVRIDHTGIHLPDRPELQAEMAALAPFSAMMRELSGIFTGSLTGVRKTFDVSADSDATTVRVHLRPRQEQWKRMFRVIELSFAAPDMVLHSMHLEEALGDRLDIVFSEVHRNDAVAAAAFGDGGAH